MMSKKKVDYKALGEGLFQDQAGQRLLHNAPLSVRMRPQNLEEFIGQKHILGEGKLLRRAIEADRISSLILYGPPGCGKTTLAYCISRQTKTHFERLNAVAANVDDLRKIMAASQNRLYTAGKKTILFIDEIHRFNKAQQDVLMPDLEEGTLILIGATVLNPFFALTSPLLSRSLVFELQPLSTEDIMLILSRALQDKEKGLGKYKLSVEHEALQFLASISDGDARRALNALEIGVMTTAKQQDGQIHFNCKTAEESIQKKQVLYDKDGDAHYDTASAFIKSMRGSDPDATLYWLAKMLYAGEDHRFIARRICICAAEDVGNADPQALILANAALQISEFIGLPEAKIPLAQAAVYVACAPKSNATYKGLEQAMHDIECKKTQEVPVYLKDDSYQGAKKLGHGAGYQYAHDYQGHFTDQAYLNIGATYYTPTGLGKEKDMKEWLDQCKKQNTQKNNNPK